MNKILKIKLIGSLVLGVTLFGILLAVGGQLNFLGQERNKDIEFDEKNYKTDNNKPKYTFYDELKQRKLEVQSEVSEKFYANSEAVKKKNKENENKKYVIQVGAFKSDVDAYKVKKQVEKLGYEARVINSGSRFLTQAGPLKGRKKAKQIELRLKKQKFPTLLKLVN